MWKGWPGCGLVVLARCWVLKDRTPCDRLFGACGVKGVVMGSGFSGCRGLVAWSDQLIPLGVGVGGLVAGGWLLVENCTVDASIFVCFC